MAAPAGVDLVAIDPHAGNDRGPQEIAGFEAEAIVDHDVFHANLARAGVDEVVAHVDAALVAVEPAVDPDHVPVAKRSHVTHVRLGDDEGEAERLHVGEVEPVLAQVDRG